jgi:hypothetical protein
MSCHWTAEGKYTLTCDVPTCAYFQFITSENIAKLHGQYPRMEQIVRAAAENSYGWFYEVIEPLKQNGNSTRILRRDICPSHAPGYKALAKARLIRTEQTTKGTKPNGNY